MVRLRGVAFDPIDEHVSGGLDPCVFVADVCGESEVFFVGESSRVGDGRAEVEVQPHGELFADASRHGLIGFDGEFFEDFFAIGGFFE